MFSFNEMLKGYKKKQGGAAKGSGQSKATTGPAADSAGDDAAADLGSFPGSVHKLWARRRRGWEATPPLDPAPRPPARGGKIAVCLTVVDQVPHEALWRRWLAGSPRDPRGRSGRLLFHAKFPARLRERQSWCGERTLAHSFVPEWNDVKVARAMLALLKEVRLLHVHEVIRRTIVAL